MITKILKNIYLTSSKHNPCLLFGIIDNSTPPETTQHIIHVGLYVNNFVFFLELDAENYHFKKSLNNKVTTNFMGGADFFIRSSFEWN